MTDTVEDHRITAEELYAAPTDVRPATWRITCECGQMFCATSGQGYGDVPERGPALILLARASTHAFFDREHGHLVAQPALF